MPRLLLCTDTFLPQINGVSLVTARSVEGLTRRGWECALVAPRYPEARAAADATHVTSIPGFPLPLYPEIRVSRPPHRALREVVRTHRPDLIHSVTEFVIGRAGRAIAHATGTPFVSSFHTDFGRYAAAWGVPFLRGAVDRILGAFHRQAACTFTPGRPAAQQLRAMRVGGVEVWGAGVDARRFHPGRRSPTLRARLGLSGRFTFVFAGRLAPEKNVDAVLDAFTLVRDALEDRVRLVIAGDGPRRPALERRAGDGVRFLGMLDPVHEMPTLMASGDAFVFASVTETLGLVILEAMASGLPVLAVPEGGISDHLVDGVNGLAVPTASPRALAEAMTRVALDAVLTQRLGAAALDTARARDWEAELDRLDVLLRGVIAAARVTPRAAG
ncbi:MAG: glycosyltransferase family 1 protein [Gemmatimonadaceae bacterium]|nr:glycosyltransferase family 1 protein [Gemmatimonadaceae bacterium]